ncbi:MAG: fibronectin type III domain-containing protein [Bacillota bacterium]|nr:fibronectin type III domain-containing protein [Bacillota bacterium]
MNPSWSKGDVIKVTKVMPDSVTIKWPPASDNSGQIKYSVLVNGVFVGETDNTTYIVSNLEPGKSYTFSVAAEDEAGNRTEFRRVKKVRTRREKKEKH